MGENGLSGHLVCLVEESEKSQTSEKGEKDGLFGHLVCLVCLVYLVNKNRQWARSSAEGNRL
jgi:hypothetical protein